VTVKPNIRVGLISLWLYKENNKLRDWKNVFTLHTPLSCTHLWLRCCNFFNPSKKILLVVLQIGKGKDLSAPLRMLDLGITNSSESEFFTAQTGPLCGRAHLFLCICDVSNLMLETPIYYFLVMKVISKDRPAYLSVAKCHHNGFVPSPHSCNDRNNTVRRMYDK
jgi:hypothetical protein